MLSLLQVAAAGAAVRASPPTVVTDRGAVFGYLTADDVSVFHSIPYAAPPIGDLRWRQPQPHPAWAEALNATEIDLDKKYFEAAFKKP